MTKNTYQAIRAHVAGSYRTETLHGQEYIVVPVVALVEGVLQGLSADGPELALAEEFGKFPSSWDGRPIVMSHPLENGSPVSANSPAMLEKHQMGMIFNSKLEGNRLLQEAWVNVEAANALNDDAKATISALQKGEMIEVSTGYFAMIEPSSGMHNNQQYVAVQRSIVPDHLAFLPSGVTGACSNADGCGAQLAVNSSPTQEFKAVKDFRIDNVTAPCCDACAAGDHSHCEGASNMSANTNMSTKIAKGAKKKAPKMYQEKTIANTIPDGLLFGEIEDLVCDAIVASSGTQYGCYLIGLTKTMAIYEMYNPFMGTYDTFQQSYSVSAEGSVTLGGDATKVELITKIIAQSESDSNSAAAQQEQSMTTTTANGTAPAAPVVANTTTTSTAPKVVTVTNDQGTLEVTLNAAGEPEGFKLTPKTIPVAQAAPAPATMQEFLAAAPAEFREVLNTSLKVHEDQKKALIAQIKDTKRCKFSDEKLSAMSLNDLQDLAELANVPSFEGVARPISANAQSDDNVADAPPSIEWGVSEVKAA